MGITCPVGSNNVIPMAAAPSKATRGPGVSSVPRSAIISTKRQRRYNKDISEEIKVDSPERPTGVGGETWRLGSAPGIPYMYRMASLGLSGASRLI